MDISQILELQIWIIFFDRRRICMTASEERLFCASSVTFLPQKTADILNYAQRQRATQKTNDAYFHLLQEQVNL